MFKIFIIKDDYIEFCRSHDDKVQDNKEGTGKFIKKYLGIVLEVNNIKYYVPLSSYKPHKHDYMPTDKIDFIRIEDSKNKYAVLNLNNMIPVPDEAVVEFDINILPSGTEEERKYRDLLRNEWNVCRAKKEKILKNANKLYGMFINKRPENIVSRCCDFKKLEAKMQEYITLQQVAVD